MRLTSKYKKAQRRQIKVLYLSTLVLLLPLFGMGYYLYMNRTPETVTLPTEEVKKISINLQQVQTTAYSAFVLNLNDDKTLYQKNPNQQLSLASITKLVTAKVTDDQNKGATIAVQKMSDPTYGDMTLAQGERWKKEDLIAYTLITSSNDGAHSLQSDTKNNQAFVASMNQLASSVGMINTKFYNETGLDDDVNGVPGSKGTAQDISKLLSYLVKNDLPLYEKTKYSTAYVDSPTGKTRAKNTNEAANDIVGLLVSKTGYTDTAGGNLAIVADMGLNEPTAFVVLHSSKESRFDDILRLQNEYFAQVANSMR